MSAAGVSTQMKEQSVLTLSICLIVAAKTEWENTREKCGNTGKKVEKEFLQLRNNLVYSEEPVLLKKKKNLKFEL